METTQRLNTLHGTPPLNPDNHTEVEEINRQQSYLLVRRTVAVISLLQLQALI
jgi:hypothetical protein